MIMKLLKWYFWQTPQFFFTYVETFSIHVHMYEYTYTIQYNLHLVYAMTSNTPEWHHAAKNGSYHTKNKIYHTKNIEMRTEIILFAMFLRYKMLQKLKTVQKCTWKLFLKFSTIKRIKFLAFSSGLVRNYVSSWYIAEERRRVTNRSSPMYS